MRHSVRKIKFSKGQDANEMLMKKLITNFFIHGKLTSTEKKIKALKQAVDKIVSVAAKKKQVSDSWLGMYFTSSNVVHGEIKNFLLKKLSKKQPGSMTQIIKLNRRESDGAPMSKLQWVVYPEIKQVQEKEQIQKSEKKEKENSNETKKKIIKDKEK